MCFFFAWNLAPSNVSWILIFTGGFAMGGIGPMIFISIVELPEIGHEYVGGASGIVIASGNAGGVLMPLVVMSPLVAAGTLAAYTIGFSAILVILAMTALVAIPLKETELK